MNENYASYLEHFGILYNFYAVSDSRGLCPNGWHVPNDGDWQALELYLGMQASQINQEGWRSSGDVGLKLKASSETLPIQWNGNDQCNFEALPGGFRDASGGYINIWNFGIWWTSSYYGSSSSASEGFRRLLHTDQV